MQKSFSLPQSITMGFDSMWVPPFASGPLEETQHHVELINYFRLTARHHFASRSLAVSFGKPTRNHILMSFHDRICRTIKTFPLKRSLIIMMPLGKKVQRGKTKTFFFFPPFQFRKIKSFANSMGPMVLDVIKLKDVAGFVHSVFKS